MNFSSLTDDEISELIAKKIIRIDKKYNRYITNSGEHLYLNRLLKRASDFSHEYVGILKCKLGHTGRRGSNIIPEFLFLQKKNEFSYIVPLGFLPSRMKFNDPHSYLYQEFDISCGNKVRYSCSTGDYLGKGVDHSHFFKVKVQGPPDLYSFSSGKAVKDKASFFKLEIFHHTSETAKDLIISSGTLKGSKWNIQGNKEIINFNRCYFTPLNSIKNEGDLIQIAMVNKGAIFLVQDGYEPDLIIDPNNIPAYVKKIEVYRSSTDDRKSSIKFLVPSTVISTRMIEFHEAIPAYWKISNPFILTIKVKKDQFLSFNKKNDVYEVYENQENILPSTNVIFSDCSSMQYIDATFDEENAFSLFKIDQTKQDPITRWKYNTNTDLFTGLPLEKTLF